MGTPAATVDAIEQEMHEKSYDFQDAIIFSAIINKRKEKASFIDNVTFPHILPLLTPRRNFVFKVHVRDSGNVGNEARLLTIAEQN